jgi:hypothetical protein
MSTATVRNVDRTTLSEEARNALLILSTLPVAEVNVLKGSQAVRRQMARDCQTYVRMVAWQGEAGRVGATARDFL